MFHDHNLGNMSQLDTKVTFSSLITVIGMPMTILLARTPGSRTTSGPDVGGNGYNVRAPILNSTALIFGNWPVWPLLAFCFLVPAGLLAFISPFGF